MSENHLTLVDTKLVEDSVAVEHAESKRSEAKKTALNIRRAAMNLLGRREHSFQELVTKLSPRFDNQHLIMQQVQLLADEKLQSDQRFAEGFVRIRVAKKQGPIRIVNELKLRGVDESLITAAMESESPNWINLLVSLMEGKYGSVEPQDEKERAKRIRFFQYRGFSFEQIKAVMI